MLNETPKAATKKTASAPKSLARVVVIGLALIGLVMTIYASLWATHQNCALRANNNGRSQCITLEQVVTPAARAKGLSGRVSLSPGRGMLFRFGQPENVCMWMKDMNFPIDIIWLDIRFRILKIEKDVRPETFPESFCQSNTDFVVEVNSGVADANRLKVGQQLNL